MGTLKEDIKECSAWLVKAFNEDYIYLDNSIGSLVEIDRFFNKHTRNGRATKNGRLASNLGSTLFSLASYVGECIIDNVKGSKWVTDDKDPQGEINVAIKFLNGDMIWPMQKVMKRFQNGSEDSIYVYAYELTKQYTKEDFDNRYWKLKEKSGPWWKFW